MNLPVREFDIQNFLGAIVVVVFTMRLYLANSVILKTGKIISFLNCTIMVSVITIICNSTPACSVDNLGLLMNTLMTHQQISCIDRPISLRCPPGTNVIIKVAQYANASPGKNSPVCDTPNLIKSSSYDTKQTNCEWPSALQYSLLQTAVEVCRSKEQCQFQVSLGKFGVEPCPGSRAQVEVEYNCRPYSFSSKVGCEHEKVNFECEPNTRLAIYSASYGRTQYQSVQCPQPQGVAEETCLLSYATEIVIDRCHGKRNCTLVADSKTFTNPCKEKSRVYLKVVYACVPRKVLLQKYEEGPDQDEYAIEEIDQHDILDNPESLAPSPDIGRRRYNESNSSAILLQHPALNSVPNTTFTGNKEKMYIYLGGSVSGILISLVIFVIICVIWLRTKSSGSDKYQENTAGNTTLPHSFNDEISEVDADITLAEVMPPITIIPSLHHISPPGEVSCYEYPEPPHPFHDCLHPQCYAKFAHQARFLDHSHHHARHASNRQT